MKTLEPKTVKAKNTKDILSFTDETNKFKRKSDNADLGQWGQLGFGGKKKSS